MNKGIELWNKAKKIIPGGTQLLSKRTELHLPEQWPCYFEKAKGAFVWDLDGHKFIDMSYMGIGACPLGYSDDDVNKAVKKVIDDGNMNTLNSPEDVELAELMIKLHPWSKKVRYARSGGEAMAVAVRIARAHSDKDKVAFCGYHGWHDWYLASNLADEKSLDGHLLPGLEPKGVPRGLKGTSLPFNYNQIEELEKIVEENKIGVIAMEVRREHEPKQGFLEKVREIATRENAVLIFDEVTSGFRMNLGGIHLLYNVIPDMAVFAKGISNGFPMACIIGKDEVMESSQDTFISSTYWTERIGPVSAIATIKKMEREDIPAFLVKTGERIGMVWKELIKKYDLKMEVGNIAPLISLSLNYGDKNQAVKTFITQEMLKKGFLASTSVYVSFCHTKEIVDQYLKAIEEVFAVLSKTEDIESFLEGPVAQSGFTRLT